ncbi:MAG: histidine phosphatase family protein, partial [Ferruginibacter sp.]
KYLYITRHAKSSWVDFAKPDFDRPLNDRGNRDAPQMAKRLLKRDVQIDAFVSSPAKRAKATCKHFCVEFKADIDKIIFMDKLYQASLEVFYEVIHALDDKYMSVAIFSHNPGITDLVNSLCENVRVDNMPTCGVFAIEINIKKWKDFKSKNNQYVFFDYPKA